MDSVKVTASTYEETAKWCKDGTCAPEHTVDGDTSGASSWRAEGEEVWIAFDLGKVKPVESIKVFFLKGSTRKYFVGIDLSVDGSIWSSVVDRDTTSGAGGWELFDFDDQDARFVRIRGYGNTNAKFPHWTNINEVEFWIKAPSGK